MCSEIEQACTNFIDVLYRSCSEIEQACTNFIEALYRRLRNNNRQERAPAYFSCKYAIKYLLFRGLGQLFSCASTKCRAEE